MLKPVRHHNLIGHEINESLELYPNKSEDREIYCRLLHSIVEPQRKDCESCPYLSGLEQGNGIECTWPDECEDDHVVHHEDRFKEFKRVDALIKKENIEEDNPLPGVSVNFAMSKEQANRLKVPVCIYPVLPESKEVYYKMTQISDELCVEKVIGWERTIKVKKENIYKALDIMYPNGYEIDVDKYLRQVDGDCIWIIGFGD